MSTLKQNKPTTSTTKNKKRYEPTICPFDHKHPCYLIELLNIQTGLDEISILVLNAIAFHSNDPNGVFFPSYRTIAAQIGVKKDTVRRRVKLLEKLGLLKVVYGAPAYSIGRRVSNKYKFNWGNILKLIPPERIALRHNQSVLLLLSYSYQKRLIELPTLSIKTKNKEKYIKFTYKTTQLPKQTKAHYLFKKLYGLNHYLDALVYAYIKFPWMDYSIEYMLKHPEHIKEAKGLREHLMKKKSRKEEYQQIEIDAANEAKEKQNLAKQKEQKSFLDQLLAQIPVDPNDKFLQPKPKLKKEFKNWIPKTNIRKVTYDF